MEASSVLSVLYECLTERYTFYWTVLSGKQAECCQEFRLLFRGQGTSFDDDTAMVPSVQRRALKQFPRLLSLKSENFLVIMRDLV